MSRSAPHKARDNCANRAAHTDCPLGYIEWHEWAEEKAKTHFQIRCPECDYWMIWIPKFVAHPDVWGPQP